MDKKSSNNNINIKNKRAEHEYFLMETLTAGIVLTGTEIKSIRNGKASLAESYCTYKGDELFVVGMHIAEYDKGTYNNHDPKRDRKLLLTERELRKLRNAVEKIEKEIADLEEQIAAKEATLANGGSQSTDFYAEYQALKDRLDERMDAWETATIAVEEF